MKTVSRAFVVVLCVFLLSALLMAAKVVDVTGVEVEVVAKPKRIVALVPSDAEMLFDLGFGENVVGVNDWAEYPQEVKDIEKIGGSPLNIEKILSLNPDFILGNYGLAPNEIEQLRKLGLVVLAINPTDLDSTLEAYLLVGRALGTEENAQSIVEELRERQRNLQVLARKPKVFVEIWNDPLMTAGKGTLWDDVITKAGGINVGASALGAFPVFNEEDLIAQNPNLIILTNFNLEEAMQRPVYASFRDRLLEINPSLYTFPTKRLWDGLEELNEALFNLQ